MDEIDPIREAYTSADKVRKKFYMRHADDIRHWAMERDDQTFLWLVTVGDLAGPALLSHRTVRKHLAYAWIDALLAEHERHPGRQRLWITFAWDTPLTWERVPNLDMKSVRNIADQHLRRSGIDGIGTLEIDTWKEIAGEPGKRMVPHVHFLGWSKNGQTIDVAALEKRMCSRRALSNSLGAHSVVIKEVGPTPKDMATIGCYMAKLPAYAKNPKPDPVCGGYKLGQVRHAPGSVTRLIEVLSFLEIGDVLFAIGEGKVIAKEIRDSVRAKYGRNGRGKWAPERDMIARHWRRIRATNGNKKFQDCNVITRVDQRRPSELDD